MKVRVLYFASLREAIGVGGEEVDTPPQILSIGDLRDHLGRRHNVLLTAKNLRVARNQNMCSMDEALAAGDEIAFFPPVTGG